MDDTVQWCDFGLDEVLMTELHRVGDLHCTCGLMYNSVTTVVLECRFYVPTRCTAEVPLVSCWCLSVCNDVAPERSNRCRVMI